MARRATTCSAMWCGVMWRSAAWCGAMWRGKVQPGVVWCGEVQPGVVWCGEGLSLLDEEADHLVSSLTKQAVCPPGWRNCAICRWARPCARRRVSSGSCAGWRHTTPRGLGGARTRPGGGGGGREASLHSIHTSPLLGGERRKGWRPHRRGRRRGRGGAPCRPTTTSERPPLPHLPGLHPQAQGPSSGSAGGSGAPWRRWRHRGAGQKVQLLAEKREKD